jgi:hypothetical protein
MRMSVVDSLMAGYSSASWAIGVLCSDRITKDTSPPFNLPYTTLGYTWDFVIRSATTLK